MNIGSYATHPAADIFPLIDPGARSDLERDIKANGLLEPIWLTDDGLVLDGRNRLASCLSVGVEPRFRTYEGDDPVGFVVSLNLNRRHLNESQRAMVAARIATLPKGRPWDLNAPIGAFNQTEAAQSVGVARRSVQRARTVLEQAAPEVVAAVDSGRLAVSDAAKLARQDKDTQREAVRIVEAGEARNADQAFRLIRAGQDRRDLAEAQQRVGEEKRRSIDAVCDLRVCSCAELFASGIRPDAVITDPPYPAEFLPTFTELAEGCKAAGVPLVAVMSGQSYLPEVYERLSAHLKYRWTLAYMTPGGQAVQQWQAKVNTSWKPVLLFGESSEWFGDVAVSRTNDNDKRFHGWGQSESGMADLVERLTKPGQLVCDPFLGGGTTATVSLALGRRFVGCDIDADHVANARARVLL
jgi:hypothetical protein